MLYIRLGFVALLIWIIWFLYSTWRINKNQIILILKRGKYFYSNPIIRQTLMASTIKLLIKFDNKEEFIIKNFDRIILNSTNPFLKPIKINKLDPRINTLKKYISDKLNSRFREEKYLNFINFWKKVEKILIKKV